MKDKNNNLDEISEQYLKEMESNNKIFEEKIKNLNQLMIKPSQKKILVEKQNEEIINKENSQSSKKEKIDTNFDYLYKISKKINMPETQINQSNNIYIKMNI